jgi:hypothetical protein
MVAPVEECVDQANPWKMPYCLVFFNVISSGRFVKGSDHANFHFRSGMVPARWFPGGKCAPLRHSTSPGADARRWWKFRLTENLFLTWN